MFEEKTMTTVVRVHVRLENVLRSTGDLAMRCLLLQTSLITLSKVGHSLHSLSCQRVFSPGVHVTSTAWTRRADKRYFDITNILNRISNPYSIIEPEILTSLVTLPQLVHESLAKSRICSSSIQ